MYPVSDLVVEVDPLYAADAVQLQTRPAAALVETPAGAVVVPAARVPEVNLWTVQWSRRGAAETGSVASRWKCSGLFSRSHSATANPSANWFAPPVWPAACLIQCSSCTPGVYCKVRQELQSYTYTLKCTW